MNVSSSIRSRCTDRNVHVVLTRLRCTTRMEHNHCRKATVVLVWNTTLCKHGEVPVLARLRVKTLVVDIRGCMTRAQNSRGHSFVMTEVFCRMTCGERIKMVTDLLKMKKQEINGGTSVAETLCGVTRWRQNYKLFQER